MSLVITADSPRFTLSSVLLTTALGLVSPAAAATAAQAAPTAAASEQGSKLASQSVSIGWFAGQWQLGKNDWISISQQSGSEISGREIIRSDENSELRPSGTTFIFNPTLPSSTTLKGVRADASGNVYNVEFHPGTTADTLRVHTMLRQGLNVQILRRVAAIGQQAGLPTVRQLLESVPKIWETPIGRLSLMDRGSHFLIAAFDSQTSERKFSLRTTGALDAVYPGNMTGWEWSSEGQAWSEASNEQLTLTFDPAGPRIYAGPGDRGSTPQGLASWIGVPYGSQRPEQGDTPGSQPPSGGTPPRPLPGTPAGQKPPALGFKPVGKFEVRLDRVVAEDRYWHVYLTLKNASTGTLVQAQGIDVRFEDSDGVGVESGQAVRAKPGPAELFSSPPPTTRPGGTLPVKFVFDKRSGANPAKIVVIEGDRSAEFTLG